MRNRKGRKTKDNNKNQTSFYFEDYLETSKKNKFSQKKKESSAR